MPLSINQRKARQLKRSSRKRLHYIARQFDSSYLLFRLYAMFNTQVSINRSTELSLTFRHFILLCAIKTYLVDSNLETFRLGSFKRWYNTHLDRLYSIRAIVFSIDALVSFGYLDLNPLGYVLTMKARAFFRDFDASAKELFAPTTQ